MLLSTIKVLSEHKKQVIPNLDIVELPEIYRGRPELSSMDLDLKLLGECTGMCPTGAISSEPFSLDMGRCIFCGECARMMPKNIRFTNSWRIWSRSREGLVVKADEKVDKSCLKKQRKELKREGGKKFFKNSIRLRQVCAGGDGSIEMELGAAGNVNFDMSRCGIEFVASPRHVDGVLITGPITKKMASPLEMTYSAVPDPRVVILAGADAISGGLFAESTEVDRSFLDRNGIDLYIAGHPSHPLAIIGGIRELMASYEL